MPVGSRAESRAVREPAPGSLEREPVPGSLIQGQAIELASLEETVGLRPPLAGAGWRFVVIGGLVALILFEVFLFSSVEAADPIWVSRFEIEGFHFAANFPITENHKGFEELPLLASDLEEELGIPIDQTDVKVLIFRDRYSYSRYVSKRVPGGASRPAVYAKSKGNSRIYVQYRSGEIATDLRHESTHALLHNSLEILPIWMDEGLAEYFEVWREGRLSESPHLGKIRWGLRFGWKPRLKQLASRRKMEEMGGRDYQDAWALVHFLLNGSPEGKLALQDYLKDVQRGVPPGNLLGRLREAVPNLEEEIVAHFQTWDPDEAPGSVRVP